jgi:HAD superfamily hydrolase (TIGR01549 family)
VRGARDAFFAFEEASWSAYPAALPVLRALAARGLRLGLFSNATSDRFIQRLVDRFGFREYLHPALSSAGVGIRKPDPAALQSFPVAWGLPAEAVVMVGDSLEADILCARRAGMRSVWTPSREDARQEGLTPEERLQAAGIRPERTIAGLETLPGCLDEMALGDALW